MSRNPVLYKSFVIGFVVLFIGFGIQPALANVSIKSDNSELVEITVQFYESDRAYNHTMMLTQELAKELKNLINNFKSRLDKTDDPIEIEIIYKNAILSLNEFGLLPDDISIDYAQRLVTGKDSNQKISMIFERWLYSKQKALDENENLYCLISGNTINTIFAGSVPLLFSLHCVLFWFRQIALLSLLEEFNNELLVWWRQNFGSLHYNLLMLRSIFLGCLGAFINLLPIKLGALMLYGNIRVGDMGYFYTIPAEGWVNTIGLSGNKSWEGSFYGGVVGFTGIKIIIGFFEFFYLGAAYKVRIEYN